MIKINLLSILMLLTLSSLSNAQTVALPYFDDFEGANAGWTTNTVAGSDWQLGLPSTAPTNSVHSGLNAWDVDLTGVYQPNTESYLISPAFDFSLTANFDATLSFWINYSTEISWDGARIDYTFNNGASWTVLGSFGGTGATNWYTNGGIGSSSQPAWDGNSNGWMKSSIGLSLLNGYPQIKFRFAFNSDPTTEVSGFTMDDFEISTVAINDISVISILNPSNNLPAGSASPVEVVIKNEGLNIQTSFPVSYAVNGLVSGTFNWSGSLAPGVNDTVTIGNLFVPTGNYLLCAYTQLSGDGKKGNDTLCQVFNGVSQNFSIVVFDSLGITGCVNPPVQDQFVVSGNAPTLNDGDSVTILFNFGDGQQSTAITTVSGGVFFAQATHSFLFSGQFSTQVIATAYNGLTDTAINYNQLIILDSCGNISGQVFADLNNNCILDGIEYPLSGIPVHLMQSGNLVQTYYTTVSGGFYFNVPSATTYDLKIDTGITGISGYCPSSGIISGVTEPSAGNNFSFVPSGNYDLEPVILPFNIIANGSSSLFIQARENYFSILPAGTLKLVMDTSLLQVSSVTPPISSTNGDTLIWNMTNIGNASNLSQFVVSLHIVPKSVLVLNSSICLTVLAEPVSGDAVPSNNIKTICGTVLNSFDPNTKTVEPAGNGATGNIDPSTPSFSYTVNFQNTGNSPAFNIFILDTIDSDLDISTLHIISSSHMVTATMVAPNVAKFSFNNIFLPDSTNDEPGSHGYVNYSIAPKPGLPDGTQITNSAYIYFDFNPAIVTNTTTNTIDYTLTTPEYKSIQSSLLIYPNPANAQVNVVINQNIDGELSMTDLYGNQLLKKSIKGNFLRLELNDYSAGVYFLTLKNGAGILTKKFMIIK